MRAQRNDSLAGAASRTSLNRSTGDASGHCQRTLRQQAMIFFHNIIHNPDGAPRMARLAAAPPVRGARTKGIYSLVVGACGACRIARAILSPTPTAILQQRGHEMAFTALPNGRTVRYSHAPSHTDRRSGSGHLHHGKTRPAANVDHSAAAQGTADHRQAEYFVRLLTESRQLIDRRIDKYHRAIAICEASGDIDDVRRLWRMKSVEEKERQVLVELIDRLERRFVLRASGEVPQSSRRARPVVR